MSGKIISFVNRKGGVGKTTLTLGLADTFVEHADPRIEQPEHCVVVVDLDPQASLTRVLLSDGDTASDSGRLGEVLSADATLAAALEHRLGSKTADVTPYLTHGVGRTGYPFSLLANDARGWDVERKGLKKHGEAKLAGALHGPALGILIDKLDAGRFKRAIPLVQRGKLRIAAAGLKALHGLCIVRLPE